MRSRTCGDEQSAPAANMTPPAAGPRASRQRSIGISKSSGVHVEVTTRMSTSPSRAEQRHRDQALWPSPEPPAHAWRGPRDVCAVRSSLLSGGVPRMKSPRIRPPSAGEPALTCGGKPHPVQFQAVAIVTFEQFGQQRQIMLPHCRRREVEAAFGGEPQFRVLPPQPAHLACARRYSACRSSATTARATDPSHDRRRDANGEWVHAEPVRVPEAARPAGDRLLRIGNVPIALPRLACISLLCW